MQNDQAVRPGRISPHVPRFERQITTKGVLFAIPCYGGLMHDGCVQGLLETRAEFDRLGLSFNIITLRNESLIPRARNGLASMFLASPCDRLFFIDSDIGFDAQQVLRILAHDRDVIGGLYRKKTAETVDFAVNFLPTQDGSTRRDPQTGALEVKHLATGFMCIKRGVIERMVAAFPHLRYRGYRAGGPEFEHGIFDCYIDPITLESLSEDYAFSMRWRALGGELWCDPGIILEHNGTLALSADPMEHLAGGAGLVQLQAAAKRKARKPARKGRR